MSKKNKKNKHLYLTIGQIKVWKDILSSRHYWDGGIEHTIIILNVLISHLVHIPL